MYSLVTRLRFGQGGFLESTMHIGRCSAKSGRSRQKMRRDSEIVSPQYPIVTCRDMECGVPLRCPPGAQWSLASEKCGYAVWMYCSPTLGGGVLYTFARVPCACAAVVMSVGEGEYTIYTID